MLGFGLDWKMMSISQGDQDMSDRSWAFRISSLDEVRLEETRTWQRKQEKWK